MIDSTTAGSSPADSGWFAAVQSVGIIASLLFTAYATFRNSQLTKVSNSLLITQHHREIWSLYLSHEKKLARVFSENPDLKWKPVTEAEKTFMILIFLHMSAAFKAQKNSSVHSIEGMDLDILEVLSLPIPKQIWTEVKGFQDRDFVDYVESLRPKF